jgi:hypothetical protein
MNVTVQAPPLYRVVVTSNTYTVNVVTPTPYTVTLTGVNTYKLIVTQTILQGPKGAKGDTGDTGLQGPQGEQGEPGTGDAFYLHDQMIAASTWTITHNLNKYPSVTIVTSAGDEVEGDVSFPTINTVTLNFSASFSGKAYLN